MDKCEESLEVKSCETCPYNKPDMDGDVCSKCEKASNKKHEEAVKEFEHNIKALKERGCVILSYSWFDDTHYHINFETPEDIKRRKEWEKDLKKRIQAREQIKQNVKDILALDLNKIESSKE